VTVAAPGPVPGRRRAALVTGASGGIGSAVAKGLVRAGFELTVSGRDEARLSALAADLALAGGAVHPIRADLAREDEVAALVRGHGERFGGMLDLLVLNAGTGTAGAIEDYPLHRFDRQVEVNLRAPFQLVQRCLPLLREGARQSPGHGARIVAVASITGIASEAGLSVYGATKAALISLCQSISAEQSADGVSATAIAPGYVDTAMSSWVRDRIDPAIMIRPGDIAELVCALTRLSAQAVIPLLPVSRPGDTHWRALAAGRLKLKGQAKWTRWCAVSRLRWRVSTRVPRCQSAVSGCAVSRAC
jgi:NAD(P)-dependent dehydrogenase (short-subunit alcohol dehydrogenase family)